MAVGRQRKPHQRGARRAVADQDAAADGITIPFPLAGGRALAISGIAR
jgi:hypothetical protein